jgi:hypothetical protein
VQPEIREQHNHVISLLSWFARRNRYGESRLDQPPGGVRVRLTLFTRSGVEWANALEALVPAGEPRLDIVAQPATPLAKMGLPSDAHNESYDRT